MNIFNVDFLVKRLSKGNLVRRFVGAFIAAAMLSGCASQFGSGVTIAEATAAHDGTQVVVTGEVVQQLDREHILLRDASGQITVKIEKEIMGEVKFAPDSRLRVLGRMDRDKERSIVIAKSVQVVK